MWVNVKVDILPALCSNRETIVAAGLAVLACGETVSVVLPKLVSVKQESPFFEEGEVSTERGFFISIGSLQAIYE